MTPEEQIQEVLSKRGPLTGSELQEATRLEILELWRRCRRMPHLRWACWSRRFLRLDRTVEGYARLSPSIRREFQTYTLLALPEHDDALAVRADRERARLAEISARKRRLARDSLEEVFASVGAEATLREKVCVLLAGDITYTMAHDVPRPEESTGEMVRGSDLDLILVADEGLEPDLFCALDTALLKKKHVLLVHPDYREEIDYVLKDMRRVREQVAFDTFERMVACKILHESEFLLGSQELFRAIKDLVARHGIPARLAAMEEHARRERERAERVLLEARPEAAGPDLLNLFYTREESEEIY